MTPVVYIAIGVAAGLIVGLNLGTPSAARCCQQLEQLVRADVRKRCGSAGDFCEGIGGALGLFGQSSALLDRLGVTS